MKFKLIIDQEEEEEVVVTAHRRTPLVDEIEALISKHTDRIPGYTEDNIKLLFELNKDNSTAINTLNTQLATVLTKIDTIIDTLNEIKDAKHGQH